MGTILAIPGRIITINATTINLSNVDAAPGFPALSTLAANTGTLTLQTGASLATTPAGGVFTNNGALTIGAGAVLSITVGNFAQTAAASLRIIIAGTNPVTQMGRILASGTATLAGGLTIELAPGYTPASGDSFQFIGANSVSGMFNTPVLPSLPGTLMAALSYTPTGVSMVVSGSNPFEPVDWNHDGVVNSGDFFAFLTCFFDPQCDSDFNHDGEMNSQDFLDFVFAFLSHP
jgi:hypothetical protein